LRCTKNLERHKKLGSPQKIGGSKFWDGTEKISLGKPKILWGTKTFGGHKNLPELLPNAPRGYGPCVAASTHFLHNLLS